MAQVVTFDNTDTDLTNDLPVDISSNPILQALAGAADTPGTTIYQPGSTLSYFFGDISDSFFGILNPEALFGLTGTRVDFAFSEEVERAYDSASLFADIEFVEASTQTSADITHFGFDDLGPGAVFGAHFFPNAETPHPDFPLLQLQNGEFVNVSVLNHNSFAMAPGAELGGGNNRSRTTLHETGHGLGLGHTFDEGNGSLDFEELNPNDPLLDDRYSVMTRFSDRSSPDITFGHAVSYMALDIAALQALYGVDNTAHLGATTYNLTDAATVALDLDGDDGSISIGRAYYSIWDSGGIDEISYGGADRVLINLNDATLQTSLDPLVDADLLALLDEVELSAAFTTLGSDVQTEITDQGHTAGGFFSSIINGDGTSVDGGFTIANGAVVEDASGGSGDDLLIGNEADNVLVGNDGDDALFGGAGDDFLFGNAGDDTLSGGTGDDTLSGGAGGDDLDGGDGFDFVSFADSSVRVQADTTNVVPTIGDAAGDTYTSIEGFIGTSRNDNLRGGTEDNIIFGGNSSDRLFGRGGDDTLNGELGTDVLYGNGGVDIMTGGDQIDRFVYFNASETGVGAGNRDIITDFDAAAGERMEIRRIDADTTQGFRQGFDFIGQDAFSDTAGELRFDQSNGVSTIVQADQDGDSIADFEIELTGLINLSELNFLI